MIYLLLTIIGASMFSFVLRLSKGRVKNKYAMYVADYVLCLILAGYYMGLENIYPSGEKNNVLINTVYKKTASSYRSSFQSWEFWCHC